MSEQERRKLVAQTNRMLYMTGLADYSGHVSHRHPDGDKAYINSYLETRGEIRPEDIVEITFDNEPVDKDMPRPPSEAEIHTSIYRKIDEAEAVLHIHPPYTTMFSISGTDLQPVHIRGSVLNDGPIPIFDCPYHVTSRELSDAMLNAMDDHKQVLLRGHGAVVYDETIQRAFARAMYLELNAYYQHGASVLGNPNPMTSEEVQQVYDHNWQDRVVHKFWRYYAWKATEEGYLPEEW